jgi:penicillin-binding protein 1C
VRRRRLRRAALALLAVVVLPVLGLVVGAALTPLPEELRQRRYSGSVRFLDRDGALLREVRADDATRARWVSLGEVGPRATLAVLAAEDRRFYEHHGVDVLAVARALVSNLVHRRVVSGASTLTMQLARLVRPTPRSAWGKLRQAALALRIEASLSKREVLEEYVNRAPFGADVRGLDAASRLYFDKAPGDLSLAEASALAAIPRGPAVYAMGRHPERVERRRDRILGRMRDAGWISQEEWARAKSEPLVVRQPRGTFGAPHLVAALQAGLLGAATVPMATGDGTAPYPSTGLRPETVTTTLARDLQREAEFATQAALRPLARRHVTAASVVVIENATGEVLAYVGSPSFADAAHGGQNDGVRAKRQPGSTLKPFVYGLAMERLGFTAATTLPDVELHLPVSTGVYAPNNYDERFHGPVRLREALANSLNVPAVWTAAELGPDAVLARMRELGFASLVGTPESYGPGIALGDGEVTLLELSNAYATLARDGVWLPVRGVRQELGRGGQPLPLKAPGPRRVMPRPIARVITDILRDDHARLASFGERSALDLPFEVAAKTGTSKGFRDNWTVGFTREVTVGVWVGNFDGSPMREVSGITGAAPLFRAVMDAAMRARPRDPLAIDAAGSHADDLVQVAVCPLSGGAPGPGCTHVVHEWLPRPLASPPPCTMHETVAIDLRNGLRASPSCPRSVVIERVFERFEPRYQAWAEEAGRGTAPAGYSPLCGSDVPRTGAPLRIGYPHDGARFLLEADRPLDRQSIAVRVEAASAVASVRLTVDGRVAANMASPFVGWWQLARGPHVLVAEAQGLAPSAPVRIEVE